MLTDEERELLLNIAQQSIRYGLQHGCALPVNVDEYPQQLQQKRATFVTLKINNELRGCIGTLQAYQPLVKDVADHAYAAAFEDSRFQSLRESEFDRLQYHISILSEPEPLEFNDEQDLLNRIRPGVDGLILEDGFRRGTFLPSVWESLPEPRQFLQHLKQKAGLPPGYWSDSIRIQRYTVEDF